MKHITTIVLILSYTQIAYSQNNNSIPDIPLSKNLKSMDFVHINSSISGYANKIEAGELLGKVSKYPDTLSQRFGKEIKLSNDYYNKKKFSEAKSVLEIGIAEEPNNLFILNTYARSAYQIDRDRSFKVYKSLISALDSIYGNHPDSIVIDLWFREAYWKLGTLYMDKGMWSDAYFEISRFIMAIQDLKGAPVYCQALEFLTECAYNLHNDKLAIYLAQRTLYYDPNNDYARMILNKIR